LKKKTLLLEEDRDKFVNILDTMGNGVCIINHDFEIQYVNPILETEFGKAEGQKCHKYFHEKETACPFCSNKEFENEKPGSIELFFKKNKKTYELFSYPIKNKDGNFSRLEVFHDVTERKKIEEEIKNSLREKELLLKEIHHRVKNNLMIVISLLKLQAQHINDETVTNVLKDSQSRIKSIANIHEHLYKSADLANIDFNRYIINLTNYLIDSYKPNDSNISIEVNIDQISLGSKSSIYCGLIITELITNALKYAFTGENSGKITVTMHSTENNGLTLIVKDNGNGVPDDFDYRNTDSLGLQLVTMFTEENLNGKIELNRKDGTEFVITFKSSA